MTRSNIRIARRHIAVLRNALLSPRPDEIERCFSALVEAAGCLRAVEQVLQSQGGEHPELRSELTALRSELAMVHRLVEHGAAFYQGWARLLGVATAGYMPSGEGAPLTAAGTLSMQG